MVDPYANIRKAMSMGPTPGPWVQDGDGVTIERALGLPPDVHTTIYARLKQWESLLNQLEEVRHDV